MPIGRAKQTARLARWTDVLMRRRDAARDAGDSAAMAQWNASLRVMSTRIVPLACPAAVWVAGRAARAAYEGDDEQSWYRIVSAGRPAEERDELGTAVVLLRTAGLWPWDKPEPTSVAQKAAHQGSPHHGGEGNLR